MFSARSEKGFDSWRHQGQPNKNKPAAFVGTGEVTHGERRGLKATARNSLPTELKKVYDLKQRIRCGREHRA
jgi:hypothetical protein